MKKLGIYSFLIAAILLTGCSQKNVEMDANAKNSDSTLDKVEGNGAANQEMMNSESMDSASNGIYAMIDGKKVFLESVYFAFDKFDLSPSMREITKSNATKLSAYAGKIKVEGNCDEWGTDEYNYALGLKRAKAVKDALVADGIDSANISLISFGESNPVCTDKNAACWTKNRRAEHRLLP
ncbi:MAG: OmpA family protein [Candidatus Marinarcus sp.]|uniref:OmpA family protein n=1 Tax=Candidatus Marinarcus sp. TaxID=3100987 RepID=UPI003B00FD5E